jgi:hypothetical protein
MDKLIAELRAIGLNTFNAENAARALVTGDQNALEKILADENISIDAQDIQRAQIAAQVGQTEAQERIAAGQLAKPDIFSRNIGIRTDKLMSDDPSLGKIDAERLALAEYVQEQIEVAMSAQGIDKTQIDMGMLTTAYKIGQDAVRNRADLIGKPEEQKIVADEAAAAALAFLKANLPVSSAGDFGLQSELSDQELVESYSFKGGE